MIVTRLRSPSGFGIYTLGLSVVLFIERFSDFNLHRSLDYFIPKSLDEERPDRARSVLWRVILLSLASTIVFAGSIYVFREQIAMLFGDSGLVSVLPIFTVLVPLLALKRIVNTTFIGIKRMEYYALLRGITFPALELIIITLLLMAGLELFGLILGHIIAVVITVIAGFVFLSKLDFVRNGDGRSVASTYNLFDYSFPLVFAGMVYSLLAQTDFFIIGYLMQLLCWCCIGAAMEIRNRSRRWSS